MTRVLTEDEVIALKKSVRESDERRLSAALAWKETVEILYGYRPHMRDYPKNWGKA